MDRLDKETSSYTCGRPSKEVSNYLMATEVPSMDGWSFDPLTNTEGRFQLPPPLKGSEL